MQIEEPDGTHRVLFLGRREPGDVLPFYDCIESIGVRFTPGDKSAIEAQVKLQCVLTYAWICDAWKRSLPLTVAAIAGDSASGQARSRAAKPRQRAPVYLRTCKTMAKKQNPGASWKDLLNTLYGDEIVNYWDHKIIQWTDEDGTRRTTATPTFQKW